MCCGLGPVPWQGQALGTLSHHVKVCAVGERSGKMGKICSFSLGKTDFHPHWDSVQGAVSQGCFLSPAFLAYPQWRGVGSGFLVDVDSRCIWSP